MGIKHFFIWFKRNHPNCITNLNRAKSPPDDFGSVGIDIDCLCIDMNGIFHSCAQKVYEYGNEKPQRRFLSKPRSKKGLRFQMKLFEEIGSQIDYYVSLVRPRKRLILCVDGVAGSAKMAQQRQRRFKSARDAENDTAMDFNPVCITPGTKFMDFLSKYIDWYVRIMVSNSPTWQGLDVIISNEKVVGEGEHKIINFIRKEKEKGTVHDSYCIHGLDADLIMLALGTDLEKIYILRENMYKHGETHILNITQFGTELIKNMKWDTTEGGKQFRRHGAIDDFIFMCFLVGNDFVPTIPTLAILEGGIDVMVDVYKTVGREFGHLTRVKKGETLVFRHKALEAFLRGLSTMEKTLLQEKQMKKESFIEDKLLDKYTKIVTSEEKNMSVVDFEGYKTEYYDKKFPVDETVREVCHNYLKGLQWVITYYKRGIPDWRWFYPYFYAPFLCDLATHTATFDCKDFVKGNPISPFIQLMAVLPPQSADLLPSPLDNLLVSDTSPIKRFYPREFEIDVSGKRREWEGIVVLPMVDLVKIYEQYDRLSSQIDKREMRRNSYGNSYCYSFGDSARAYNFSSFYGNIEDCRTHTQICNF